MDNAVAEFTSKGAEFKESEALVVVDSHVGGADMMPELVLTGEAEEEAIEVELSRAKTASVIGRPKAPNRGLRSIRFCVPPVTQFSELRRHSMSAKRLAIRLSHQTLAEQTIGRPSVEAKTSSYTASRNRLLGRGILCHSRLALFVAALGGSTRLHCAGVFPIC
jgi:hypothetical protein